jgi:hypothetical protein
MCDRRAKPAARQSPYEKKQQGKLLQAGQLVDLMSDYLGNGNCSAEVVLVRPSHARSLIRLFLPLLFVFIDRGNIWNVC